VKSTSNYYFQKSMVMSWSAQLLQLACDTRTAYWYPTRHAHHPHSHPSSLIAATYPPAAAESTLLTRYNGGGVTDCQLSLPCRNVRRRNASAEMSQRREVPAPKRRRRNVTYRIFVHVHCVIRKLIECFLLCQGHTS